MRLLKNTLFILALLLPTTLLAEPPNLDIVKQELVQYHDSGAYYADIAKTTNKATDYLQTRIDENNKLPATEKKKLAIVLDIDETALSNYPSMAARHFCATLKEDIVDEEKANDDAIPGTLKLYQFAINHGVDVFLITGRSHSMLNGTSKNLKDMGYSKWQALIMRPNDYAEKSISLYKSAAREKIVNEGYDIVLNVGDQESDLIGGYADKTFKLPNPYYFIP